MILQGSIQKYDWGKKGSKSLISSTFLNPIQINENDYYAEYWMGTHSQGPSLVTSILPLNEKWEEANEKLKSSLKNSLCEKSSDSLVEIINDLDSNQDSNLRINENNKNIIVENESRLNSMGVNENIFIDKINKNDKNDKNDKDDLNEIAKIMNLNEINLCNNYPELSNILNRKLNFLFKMLSINKSLSIQVHPDKDSAKKLYSLFPQIYRDDQPKPEMVLAITPMEILCSFRPLDEIYIFVCHIKELRELIPEDVIKKVCRNDWNDKNNKREFIKLLFTSFMKNENFFMQKKTIELYQKLEQIPIERRTNEENYFIKLYNQHPGDPGCFCIFFLNIIQLKQDQAIYLEANEPHAYISGDCVEIMNSSDNVIRCGLTSKFKDIDTLCNVLTYSYGEPEILKGKTSHTLQNSFLLYKPNILNPSFEIEKITLNPSDSHLINCNNDTIIFIYQGEIVVHPSLSDHKKGAVLFLVPGNTIYIISTRKTIIYLGRTLI